MNVEQAQERFWSWATESFVRLATVAVVVVRVVRPHVLEKKENHHG